MLHSARKFGQNSLLKRNIPVILESLITREDLPHHPKKDFTTYPVPKSHCHISHNYQPPEADFEAIYL